MSSVTDFDFFRGRWRVQHRRLLLRLAGRADWQEFGGTSHNWALLGGEGNVDDNWVELPAGPYRAAGLRSWNAATRAWSIWWLDGRYPGVLDAPMVGAFEGTVGSFHADDVFEGRPIRVRFLWTRIETAMPRWEQAFSTDGGSTWETNWVMDFQREPDREACPREG